MNYKSISFRLNMDDESERAIYNRLVSSAEGYVSISAFLKHVISCYYETEERRQMVEVVEQVIKDQQYRLESVIRDEISKQGLTILGGLLASMGNVTTEVVTTKPSNLPKEEDVFPESLSGVLSMFE